LRRLNELGFVWDFLTTQWEAGYNALVKFKNREGHCRVSQYHIEDGIGLGAWIIGQRHRRNKADLTEDRLRRLGELGFVWDPYNDKWEAAYNALVKFVNREGHCQVSYEHLEDNYRLGGWVVHQRHNKLNLTEDRLSRLNELGFVWDPLTTKWEAGYSALVKFKDREGHCRVPTNHVEDGYQLGKWCSVQKQKKEEMNADRRTRLDKVCFIWNLRKS
jgi:hypothetical protein